MLVIPKPPAGFIKIDYPKKKSPEVTVLNKEAGTKWIAEVKVIIEQEMSSSSFLCCAPETRRKAFWISLRFLVKSLEEDQTINLWNANREIAKERAHFNDLGFSDACNTIFEC